ncbi:hypothetical protein RI129_005091 [Pyrocoelia pectoralis]|uniref:Uncharacterized protein n=1 Tax=Pyrocoelia pectoralis TaxID=417401 RepID=A0AAN7ZL64_9COLE
MDGGYLLFRPRTFIVILLTCVGLFFYINIYGIVTKSLKLPQPKVNENSKKNSINNVLIQTDGCRIAYMDPFDPSIRQYISEPEKIVCNNNTPPLMEANITYVYVLNSSLKAYKVKHLKALKCCYSPFHRVEPTSDEKDNKVSYDTCVQFNGSAKIEDEFIRVSCTYEEKEIYKDFFSFVPVKSRIKNFSSAQSSIKKHNVLVIGLDSISRLNLHRQMPITVKTLKDMDAIELLGYNKVGDNTFSNLIPVLTGLSEDELIKYCWRNDTDKFDECNFVWKNYSQLGYATSFSEDSAWMGVFNYAKRGFKQQPTDYYWGAFNYISEHKIGNNHYMNVDQCLGSRATYQEFLEYTMKFVQTMTQKQIPYFGFFWGNTLSHDELNKPKLGDESYANFFNNLIDSHILNNTVLIFMSDHGIRWGDIRETYQGLLEERLPFLFMVLPKNYRYLYPEAFANIKRNIKSLTSPFDLHETLKDLLDPFSLKRTLISKRISNRKGNERSYSLFEPIPSTRTCETAGISAHHCTCQISTAINKSDSVVINAANFTVNYLNHQLHGYAGCAKLTLSEIYSARIHSAGNDIKSDIYSDDFTIMFRTVPGNGKFEATIRQYIHTQRKESSFHVMGTVSRINLYKSQSWCMTNFHIKLYCYCL